MPAMTPERLTLLKALSTGSLLGHEVAELLAEVDRLRAENEQLRRQVEGHAARIAAQSELLAKRAEWSE